MIATIEVADFTDIETYLKTQEPTWALKIGDGTTWLGPRVMSMRPIDDEILESDPVKFPSQQRLEVSRFAFRAPMDLETLPAGTWKECSCDPILLTPGDCMESILRLRIERVS